jgi:signal transduction histidine kinase
MGVLLVDKHDRIVQSNGRAVEFARIDKFVEGEPLDAPQHGMAGTVLAKLLFDARHDCVRTSREWTPSHMPPEHISAELMRALADPDAPTFRFDAMEGETELPRPLRLSVELHGTDGDALILLEDMTMNQAVHELRRLDEMKTSFISLVSHELRTPLTSLRGAVSLLANFYNEGLSDTHKELLRIVGTSSDRLGGIVNMIIDTAMIEQQQLNCSTCASRPLENALNPVIEEAKPRPSPTRGSDDAQGVFVEGRHDQLRHGTPHPGDHRRL